MPDAICAIPCAPTPCICSAALASFAENLRAASAACARRSVSSPSMSAFVPPRSAFVDKPNSAISRSISVGPPG